MTRVIPKYRYVYLTYISIKFQKKNKMINTLEPMEGVQNDFEEPPFFDLGKPKTNSDITEGSIFTYVVDDTYNDKENMESVLSKELAPCFLEYDFSEGLVSSKKVYTCNRCGRNDFKNGHALGGHKKYCNKPEYKKAKEAKEILKEASDMLNWEPESEFGIEILSKNNQYFNY